MRTTTKILLICSLCLPTLVADATTLNWAEVPVPVCPDAGPAIAQCMDSAQNFMSDLGLKQIKKLSTNEIEGFWGDGRLNAAIVCIPTTPSPTAVIMVAGNAPADGGAKLRDDLQRQITQIMCQ